MYIFKFMGKRLALGLSMLLATLLLGYVMMSSLTGNVALSILGPGASDEQLEAKNTELGLDDPVLLRFLNWLLGALRGDLGVAWFAPEPVSQLVAGRVPVTLSLVLGAIVISLLIAVSLGLLAGVRRGWVDRVVQLVTVTGFIIPPFLLALALILVVSVQLRWLPPTGYVPLDRDPAGWAASLILPVASLCLGVVAGVTQQMRRSVIDIVDKDFVRTLRSRGLSERRIVWTNVLKNATGVSFQVLALQAIGLLGGAVIAEQIFAMPGLGASAISFTPRGDLPTVMGILLALSLIVFAINIVTDFVIALLNPKVALT
ncbi:ABC transporter permease [Pseudoclavibacter endophyticus]|nr:ABC transporter permease [Pseudoclavibacter endophyticus]GGA63096.1 ABC transporter permease [Pseudoclavibacter endophyticus]